MTYIRKIAQLTNINSLAGPFKWSLNGQKKMNRGGMMNRMLKNSSLIIMLLSFITFSANGSREFDSNEGEVDKFQPSFSNVIGIHEMPVEIIERITSHLPEKDYKAMAYTSRFMRDALLNQSLLIRRLKLIVNTHLADERLLALVESFNNLWQAGGSISQRIAETQQFHAEYLVDIKSLWYTIVFYYHYLQLKASPIEGQYFCKSYYFDAQSNEMKPGFVHLNLSRLEKIEVFVNKYESLNLLFYFHTMGRCENLDPHNHAQLFLMALKPLLERFDKYNLELCYQDGWENKHTMLIFYVPPLIFIEREVQQVVIEEDE